MKHTDTQVKALQDIAEFDHPFVVVPSGHVFDTQGMTFLGHVYAPEVYHSDDNDIDIMSDEWEALTGYTGQYGYNGAVLHPSEYLGGGLVEDILSNPGVYVVTTVEVLPEDDDEYPEPAGWAVLKLKGK